jgi:hypothetical protein
MYWLFQLIKWSIYLILTLSISLNNDTFCLCCENKIEMLMLSIFFLVPAVRMVFTSLTKTSVVCKNSLSPDGEIRYVTCVYTTVSEISWKMRNENQFN